jgi:hypothetical protein
MDDKSFASGNMLHATLPSSEFAERLPLLPSKKMLKKWRLVSLFSLTLDEAQDTLQRLELYRTQPDNTKVEWLDEAINSLNHMISSLETDSVLDALLKANSANSLMVIAKELIAVRKEQREKVESELYN